MELDWVFFSKRQDLNYRERQVVFLVSSTSRSIQSAIQWTPEVNVTEHEANPSLPCNAEVKNEYSSAPHTPNSSSKPRPFRYVNIYFIHTYLFIFCV